MADIASTVLLGLIVTFVPLYVGLELPRAVRSRTPRSRLVLSAVTAGIYFWFFLDIMGDAALLGVAQRFSGGYTQALLALAFAFGLAILLALEGRGAASTGPASTASYRLAAIVALGVGFHTFGEGMDIGSVTPGTSSLLDIIGGVLPGTAYVLHKLLEGFVIGVFAWIADLRFRQIGVLGLISGIPTALGFFAGVPSLVESTYFFAMGGAGALYIETKLLPTLPFSQHRILAPACLLAGFYLTYLVGLLH